MNRLSSTVTRDTGQNDQLSETFTVVSWPRPLSSEIKSFSFIQPKITQTSITLCPHSLDSEKVNLSKKLIFCNFVQQTLFSTQMRVLSVHIHLKDFFQTELHVSEISYTCGATLPTPLFQIKRKYYRSLNVTSQSTELSPC